MTNLDRVLKGKDITLLTKIHIVKAMIFPVVMFRCERWTIKKAECQKNWSFWTVVLEKTLESPLDCKEIKPVNPKKSTLNIHWKEWCWSWNSSTLATWLTGKDPDAGKDWRQEEKWTTEDEMVGRDHQLVGHEFEQTPRDSERQGSLMRCCPWGHKESDTTEWLNNNNGGRPGREMVGRCTPDEQLLCIQ